MRNIFCDKRIEGGESYDKEEMPIYTSTHLLWRTAQVWTSRFRPSWSISGPLRTRVVETCTCIRRSLNIADLLDTMEF